MSVKIPHLSFWGLLNNACKQCYNMRAGDMIWGKSQWGRESKSCHATPRQSAECISAEKCDTICEDLCNIISIWVVCLMWNNFSFCSLIREARSLAPCWLCLLPPSWMMGGKYWRKWGGHAGSDITASLPRLTLGKSPACCQPCGLAALSLILVSVYLKV